MQFTCDACKLEHKCEDEQELNPKSALPKRWFARRIAGDTYTLCDVCGNIRHFKGGMSPYLIDTLGLDAGARCEFFEEDN